MNIETLATIIAGGQPPDVDRATLADSTGDAA